MTNEEIIEIQKNAITTGTGGQLSPEELASFIESGVQQTNFIAEECQVLEVTASQMNIDVLEVSERLLRKGVEGTEFTTKSGITLPRRSLTPVEVVLYYQITDKFLRRNISREKAAQMINDMFAKRFMNDVLDLGINGDDDLDTGAEPFLSILDGVIKEADNDADVNDEAFTENDKMTDVLAKLVDKMPNDFSGDEDKLRFYLSPANYRKYLRELKERNTVLGDQAAMGVVPLFFEGIKLVKINRMPDTKIIHTLTKNLAVGYGLRMTAETQRDAKMRATDYVVTAEVDMDYAISKAIVLGTRN